MKNKIKNYLNSLSPSDLGLRKKGIVKSIKKLGQGTSNLNYLVNVNGKKFVVRINADFKNPKKSRREFEGLKIIEKRKIGPKPRILEENKKYLGADFLIIDYLEGKTIDKTRIYLKDLMIKEIAKLLAKMHSIKITSEMKKNLPLNAHNPETIMSKVIYKYLRYIRKHIKHELFWNMLNESLIEVKKSFKKIPKTKKLVLSQGDFCEQNIIYHKGNFKLIDFEDLQLTNPIEQVAHTVMDFGKPFNEEQRKLFFKEYLKIRKEKNLAEQVENFIPVLYLSVFLWAVEHALKIKNKEFHNEYLKDHNIEGDLEYVQVMFKRNIRAGVIDKKYGDLNLRRILLSR